MAATTDFVIRAGDPADADGITDVQVASWRAGYAHVFPESVLYADDFDSSRRTFWNNWRFGPGHRVAVVTEPVRRRRRTRDRVLLVRARARARPRLHRSRRGVGVLPRIPTAGVVVPPTELMEHVEQRLKAEGFATAVLWVLDDNPRARRFYERQGGRRPASPPTSTTTATSASPRSSTARSCDGDRGARHASPRSTAPPRTRWRPR